ncbi:MAG: YdcF family protein [Anaerolineales bacterium]
MPQLVDTAPQLKTNASKTLSLLLLVVAVLLAAWALTIAFSIYSFSQLDETSVADVAVVLGAGTRSNGPSPVFRERIDHAIVLYRAGIVDAVILTGGIGQGRQVADSEIARQYALENNLPSEAIFIEITSQTTLQNLVEARLLMQRHAWQSALVVSDPLHMYRALAMANDLGLNARTSPTPTSRIASIWSNAIFLVREVILVFQYSLLGK